MITQTEAEQLALNFLTNDLEIPEGDRDWFKVKASRSVADEWYVVELEVEGYPDTWALQVYENRVCDPCYTFMSPLSGSAATDDLAELPIFFPLNPKGLTGPLFFLFFLFFLKISKIFRKYFENIEKRY